MIDGRVPIASHGGLSGADVSFTSQHFEGRRLPGSVNSQQTKALKAQTTVKTCCGYGSRTLLENAAGKDRLCTLKNRNNLTGPTIKEKKKTLLVFSVKNSVTSPLLQGRRHKSGPQLPSSCPHTSVQREKSNQLLQCC